MSRIDDAIEAAHVGRLEEALALLERLKADPAHQKDALGHRAWLLKSLGRYEEALGEYDRLLQIQPGEREAQRQRADTLRRLGRIDEAIKELLALINSDPLDIAASRLLTQAQDAAGASATIDNPYAPPPLPTPAKPLNPVLDTIERDPGSFPTSIFPEVGRLLYNVVRCARPAMVVETGCHIAYSTLSMAQALEDNGCGHIHSFDLFPPDSPTKSPVVGPCATRLEAARAHVEHSGLAHRVTLHPGDSSKEITRFFDEQRQAGRPHAVDLAFIDGDHLIKGCLDDFLAVDRLLVPGGLILLHDTIPDHCHWTGPRYLLESLPEKARGLYQCVNLPTGEGIGVGILQKTGGDLVGPWRPPLTDVIAEYFLVRKWWPGFK